VDVEDVTEPEWIYADAEGDRVFHGGDVAEDGPGSLVAGARLLGFRSGEAAL
jgi:hypothetical protein